jgi:arylsulfatase A-like enzyme
MEHGGLEHGQTLYRKQLHVPLITRLPDGVGAGRRVAELARQLDIAPTVRALAGLPPADTPGRVLIAADGKPLPGDDEAAAETHLKFVGGGLEALMTASWKVIVHDAGNEVEVYDLAADPGEERDVASEHPVLAGFGRQRLNELAEAQPASTAPAADTPPLDSETLERLRPLGYLSN